MKYKKILITGGAGFIGSHLTDHLIGMGYHVRVMDNLHPQIHPDGQAPKYLNPKAEFLQGDVVNRDDWRKALMGMDAVVHFAAAVGVGQSMYQIERYIKVNSLGTGILLDILANESHSIKKMLVAASMSSFGEGIYRCNKCANVEQPELRKIEDMKKGIWEPLCTKCHSQLTPIATNEDAKLKSPSVYAITKKNQEELLIAVGRAYNVPAVSLRFFNAYGPRQSLSNPYNGVAAIFLSRVKNGKPPVINEDGKQTRDFIHIKDIVQACELTLEDDRANYEVFNVGSGQPTTINEVARVVLKLYQSDFVPEITGKFRSFDVRHCFADVSKLKRFVGWEPSISFADGMKEVFEWSKTAEAKDLVDEALKELETRGLR